MAAPNPFTDAVGISINVKTGEKATLTVYDALFRPVKELFSSETVCENQSISWNGTSQDGSQTASGVYLITLQTESVKKTVKVVKR